MVFLGPARGVRLLVFVGMVASTALPLAQAQGIITTVAGSTWRFPLTGVIAANVPLGQIQGLAVDSAGNIYAADRTGCVVVKISSSGAVTLVAGTGTTGLSGDGGPAQSAMLSGPQAVALDASGNVYIADTFNGRIRKVDTNGIITTFAGGNCCGFSGDGGPAVSASLSNPLGVAVDSSGNVYIADGSNNRIRKVDTSGTITTFAGNGTAGFFGDGGPPASASLNGPTGLAFDSSGALYIADSNSLRVRKIPRGGAITTVAGTGQFGSSGDGGAAISAQISSPLGVTTDQQGNLYIADTYNNRIRKVSTTGIITTVVGQGRLGVSGDGGPALSATLGNPWGVAVDSAGNLYIGDQYSHRIRKVSTSGTISAFAGSGVFKFSSDGILAVNSYLSIPPWSGGLAVDTSGNIYVADNGNQRVRKISANGIITTVAGNGSLGYSGDGGPATQASLSLDANSSQQMLAMDAAGNLYIADNNNYRVRKVDANGIITTVAGNGNGCCSGDGGPATSASLDPRAITLDSSGNLYIADGFSRVRKVAGGTITTVAGNGTSAFSGDGGPATSASLYAPLGIALDGAGNLYIADSGDLHVRKVDTRGVISTIAGTGQFGCSGDGGPATQASLGGIQFHAALATDSAGNVYLANVFCNKIQKISGGTLNLFAGSGAFGFEGDGGPAINAALREPTAMAFDSAGNFYFVDSQNDRVRKVLAAAPTFSVSPATLSFTAPAGTAVVPSQQIATSSNVTGIIWSAQSSTQDGNPWLTFSPPYGYTPASLNVSVSTAGLKPGSYQGAMTMQAPLAGTPNQTVTVQLTATVPVPPQLLVAPSALKYQILTGSGNPPPQTLVISNGGDGTIAWTAQATTGSAGSGWLTLNAASGTSTAASPAVLQASVDVTGLAAGVYSGSIKVSSATTNQTQSIPVTLVLSLPTPTILLSQTGLTFTTVVGGGNVPAQSVGVLNVGQGTMNWSATATTLSGGSWLNASPSAGSSTANSLQIPLTAISANAAGLSAGQYTGQVAITAPGATNSPQYVVVVLNVLPRGSALPVLVRPTGLIFASQAANAASLSLQTVTLATGAPADVGFASGLLTYDGGTWLTSGTSNSVVPSGSSTTLTILPKLGGLAPGIYRGGMTVLFSDGSPSQVVDVLAVVVPASSPAANRKAGAASGCTPQKLHMVQRTLSSNFGSPVGYPTSVEAQVVDDCGNAVSNATVLATFSSGEPALALASLGNGTYVATWQPVQAGQVTVSLRASLPPLTPATTQAQGSVGANPSAPLLYAGGVVSAASFAPGGVFSPGEIVSAFGLNLAASTAQAPSVPLPSSLGGATMQVGGINVPLFYVSKGQINGQIPFELAPGSQPQVVARGASFIAPPQAITMVPAAPSIFTLTQDGKGQGAILNTQFAPVNSANPATAGDIVSVFATGLGATSPAVLSGAPAPAAEPLARVINTVTAGVGGLPAVVTFAGLSPGFVGLYQVNVQIPAGVSTGPAVPLVLSQSGVVSNTVTLAIR